ncbi:MAG: hypothetical protein QXO02_09600 [Thermofilaceae archaeon]
MEGDSAFRVSRGRKGSRGRSRSARRIIRSYAWLVLDLLGSLDLDQDLIEQAVKGLEEVVRRGESHSLLLVDQGLLVSVSDVLEFLKSASERELSLFKSELERALKRRESEYRDAKDIEARLRAYAVELGVPVPIYVEGYSRSRVGGGRHLYTFKVTIGTSTYLDEFVGSFEELIEALKEVVEAEAEKIAELIVEAEKEREAAVKSVRGLGKFLGEIESHIVRSAIITFGGAKLARPRSWMRRPRGWRGKWSRRDVDQVASILGWGLRKIEGVELMSWDVERATFKGRQVLLYGAAPELWPDFYAWLTSSLRLSRALSVILRSFREEVDELTGLPVKEIRGYVLALRGGELSFTQLSAKEVLEVSTADPLTGRRLEPEPAVVYCGPGDDKIFSASSLQGLEQG